MAKQEFHLFFTQDNYNVYFNEMQKKSVMDITDIVTADLGKWGEPGVTIESKINADYRYAMKGELGQYYMLPHYELYSGVSYDVDLFVKEGFYLANSGLGTKYTTTLLPNQTFYFTGNATNKTVGNDGIAGTDDDGMPTTLSEFVAMCEYIKSKKINVFSTAGIGAHIDYVNYLVDALWTALAGYEQKAALTSHKGTVKYVTGVSDEEIWPGTGIMKPIIETVTLKGDSTDGYKAINQAGRYYAFAFIELAYQQGWFYRRVNESAYTHKEAMKCFMLNGIGGMDKIAGHIEGSHWYNEAKGYGLFNDYKVISGTGKDYKNIGHWHMPTSVENNVVTSANNARDEVLTNSFTSNMMINGNIIENEGLVKACKDFFQFLCTDNELKEFTATTGVAKALYNYEIDDSVLSKLDPYQQTVMRLRANNPIVHQYGDTNTYRSKANNFMANINGSIFRPFLDGVTYKAVYEVYYKTGQAGASKYKNAWECFQVTGFSESKWLRDIYKA